ncbi:MAG: alpha-mannosidase [Anaerolineales bacterium]
MTRLHFIPHTHWDREWYLPFQEFRLKLVHLIDRLIEILQSQPEFTHFTLDGQTIVLDDYLQVRPKRFETLRELVQAGRLLIGPWYVMPDEFLVSPEAILRNLLIGRETAERFGDSMPVGYIPDPFGHIAQLPQILRGFGLQYAAFRRGLGSEPVELLWQAPDGSRVLVSYLRDGYDNAARAPVEPDAFQQFIERLRESLQPHAACSALLLMNGTDHHEAQPEIPDLVKSFHSERDQLVISTLPAYFQEIEAEIEREHIELPVIEGDLRDGKRHHLLPGVLSSRTWIKQRNHACETLLECWAEPFSSLAGKLLGSPQAASVWTGHLATPRISKPADVLQTAWRLLLTCHPHDSICGCSIDQVHREMRTRFDQVEQIAEEVIRQNLQDLADAVDTLGLGALQARGALVVFNPHDFECNSWVAASLELPAGLDPFGIVDEDGQPVPYRITNRSGRSLADMELDGDGLRAMLAFVQGGEVMGLSVQEVAVVESEDTTTVDVTLAEEVPPSPQAVERGLQAVLSALESHPDGPFHLVARFATRLEIELYARGVPGLGFRTLGLVSARNAPKPSEWADGRTIENEFHSITVADDGTLSLHEKTSNRTFRDLLQFSDVGERGDSYTHSPVGTAGNPLKPFHCSQPTTRSIPGGQEIEYQLMFEIPAGLTSERDARQQANVEMPVEIMVRSLAGVPRADVLLRVINHARDHRLQVLFPSGINAQAAIRGGAFDICLQPTAMPTVEGEWLENPVVEKPMRDFVMAGEDRGLLIACHGLYEAGVDPDGTIAITLLRCFGWLSRDDLPNRKGGAGPQLETPEAQEIGEHQFELSLIPCTDAPLEAVQQAHAFQSMLRGVGTGIHRGKLPPRTSLLRSKSNGFYLTACKLTGDDRMLVRGVNLTGGEIRIELEFGFDLQRAWLARMDESERDEIPLQHPRVLNASCRPKEVKTFLVKVEPL